MIFLGFIVSKYRILVDILKVEAIIKFPPPLTINQLQSFQEKEICLWRFIANYTEITKGFMHILKKGVPFIWDNQAQYSFDSLKKALMSTPLLSPPDYTHYLFLYNATSKSTIGMVLV